MCRTMRTHKLHWISLSLTAALSMATGCPKDDDGDEGNNDTGTEAGSETNDPSATMSASSTNPTTTAGEATTDPTMSTTASTMSTTDATTGEPEPLENGEMCEADDECISGYCFVVGLLGGICGDCNTDADCAATTMGGCSIPNPLSTPPQGATCNNGEAGAGCMTSDVCEKGLQCAEILNVPGVLVASTCSECLADADCGKDLCSPTYDVLGLSGQLTCVPPASVADGEGCDLDGSGDMACASGHCATADVMGLLQLGVCSACEVDADCEGGGTCVPPEVDLMTGLVAGVCM